MFQRQRSLGGASSNQHPINTAAEAAAAAASAVWNPAAAQ